MPCAGMRPRPKPLSSPLMPLQPPSARQASQSSNEMVKRPTENGFAKLTRWSGSSPLARSTSVLGVPIMNEPLGTTTISGQASHSLKLSLGLNACSSSGVSGWTPFSGKYCFGSGAGGVWPCSADDVGFGPIFLSLADAPSTNETTSAPAINAGSSFDSAVMDNPSRGTSNAAWSRPKGFAFDYGYSGMSP